MFSFLFQQKQPSFLSSWLSKYIENSRQKFIQNYFENPTQNKFKKVFFELENNDPSLYYDFSHFSNSGLLDEWEQSTLNDATFYMITFPLGLFFLSKCLDK